MIYIISLLLSLFLAIWYDILGQTSYKNTWYYILLLWFIALSALQFQVGTDIPYYMLEYQLLDVDHFQVLDIFEGGEDRRQPGWLFLSYICKFITDEYVFFKTIQAVFVNVAIFSFFKRESQNIFLCIFLYVLIGYLVINFNVIRQSFALGFALYGYSYLKNNQIGKYSLCVIGAFMFHNSAFLLILPLCFKFLKYNKTTLWITFGFAIALVYFLSTANLIEHLLDLFKSGAIDLNVSSVGMGYMQSEDLGVRDEFSIFTLRRLCMVIVLLYFLVKTRNIQLAYMGFVWFMIQILLSFFPIIWRFRIYFDYSYFLILATFIRCFEFPKLKHYSKWISLAVICMVLFFYLREYFSPYPNSSMLYIDQYYPYHSVFNPVIEYKRLNYFQ